MYLKKMVSFKDYTSMLLCTRWNKSSSIAANLIDGLLENQNDSVWIRLFGGEIRAIIEFLEVLNWHIAIVGLCRRWYRLSISIILSFTRFFVKVWLSSMSPVILCLSCKVHSPVLKKLFRTGYWWDEIREEVEADLLEQAVRWWSDNSIRMMMTWWWRAI